MWNPLENRKKLDLRLTKFFFAKLKENCWQICILFCKIILYFFLFHQANVVCKQLGFSKAAEFTIESQFGAVSENFSFFQIVCNGQEHTLEDCKHEKTDDCGPNEGAGVVCIGSFAILRLVENLETIRIFYWACLKRRHVWVAV